ncbi:MAG TPA: helix-turn-helix transcriptional regulator [Pseudomonadota bacterium]|nr:helix-turn-helix transcriptional regulator [Pseudomonadota bacterium]
MTSSAKTTAVPSTRSTDTTTSAVEFAKLLRDRRETAGLSRRGLAEASGLSEATIKFIELGKTRPSRRTLLQLLMVPGLGLLSHDLPMPRRELPKGLFSPQSTPRRKSPNCTSTPGAATALACGRTTPNPW